MKYEKLKISLSLCLLISALLALFLLPLSATENAEEMIAKTDMALTAEEPHLQEENSKAEEWMTFLLNHLSELLLTASAVYLAFPKWGGFAVLIGLFRKLRNTFDDSKNSHSVYNLLAGNADAVSRFMNDAAPLLAQLAESRSLFEESAVLLKKYREKEEENTAALQEAKKAVALIGKEFCDFVSLLPNLSEAQKETYRAAWQIHQEEAAVKEEILHEEENCSA